MSEPLQIAPETLSAFTSFAIGEYPKEAVALLGAIDNVATTLYAVRNAAREPERTYIVHPDDQVEAMTEMARRGETLGAVLHSHPHGAPELSPFDVRVARLRPGVLQVVVCIDQDAIFAAYVDNAGQIEEVSEAYQPNPVEVNQ